MRHSCKRVTLTLLAIAGLERRGRVGRRASRYDVSVLKEDVAPRRASSQFRCSSF